MMHQLRADPANHEGFLLFKAFPDKHAVRPREVKAQAVVVEPVVPAIPEMCDPSHFKPRWWRAPETAE